MTTWIDTDDTDDETEERVCRICGKALAGDEYLSVCRSRDAALEANADAEDGRPPEFIGLGHKVS